MKNYLLDSSFIIDLIKEESKAIEIHNDISKRALTSVICFYELSRYSGIISEKISEKEIVPFEKKDALEAANIYRELEKNERMIGETDIMIGANARARDLVLVTRDNDFKKIDNLEILFYKID